MGETEREKTEKVRGVCGCAHEKERKKRVGSAMFREIGRITGI